MIETITHLHIIYIILHHLSEVVLLVALVCTFIIKKYIIINISPKKISMLVVMLQDTILINKLYNVWRQLQTREY